MNIHLMPSFSLYDILGIDKSASIEEVRRAYKRKALATHPDKLEARAKGEDKLYTEGLFRLVREAFEILGDPQKRQAYDAGLNPKRRSKTTESDELKLRTTERPEKQSDARYPNGMPNSDLLKRRMRDREEWARKQEEQHKLRMESIGKQPASKDLSHQQELVTKFVKEMANALNDAIPGWLERKRRAEQFKAEQAANAKLANKRT